MKIAVVSDIHLDINQDYPVLEVMCDTVEKKECQGLILAGDISSAAVSTLEWLEKMKKRLSVPLWFVPGNHDMWDDKGDFADAWQILKEYEKLEGCLSASPVFVGENGMLTGNVGWYDYSLGTSAYTAEEYNRKTHNGRTWQDSLFAHWKESDVTVCRRLMAELEQNICQNKDKKIIAVTHMIGIPEFQVPLDRPDWDYFNAFLGNASLSSLYEREQVYAAVMGHVHYRKQAVRNGVDYRCACLGYYKEWYTDNLVQEMDDSMQVIEI